MRKRVQRATVIDAANRRRRQIATSPSARVPCRSYGRRRERATQTVPNGIVKVWPLSRPARCRAPSARRRVRGRQGEGGAVYLAFRRARRLAARAGEAAPAQASASAGRRARRAAGRAPRGRAGSTAPSRVAASRERPGDARRRGEPAPGPQAGDRSGRRRRRAPTRATGSERASGRAKRRRAPPARRKRPGARARASAGPRREARGARGCAPSAQGAAAAPRHDRSPRAYIHLRTSLAATRSRSQHAPQLRRITVLGTGTGGVDSPTAPRRRPAPHQARFHAQVDASEHAAQPAGYGRHQRALARTAWATAAASPNRPTTEQTRCCPQDAQTKLACHTHTRMRPARACATNPPPLGKG